MTELSFLIGPAFALTGFALLQWHIVAYDVIKALQDAAREVEQTFGHDQLIFPDYEH